ncbi:long-chain-fatty-acid--CoA ligase [Labrys miyagiensis]|uniref:Long-chain-fatty-acid--CoA ligase n=1 Tax=Labrys miyagiensis TaxID=346912 RepID=A0ABQ6CKA6_9HYPH|nr:AMP-binding protein [Labrys miyagiensis]GLS20062.1 long-chain-fatty-acid--CoA ligase [Labrys miyagiensis]
MAVSSAQKPWLASYSGEMKSHVEEVPYRLLGDIAVERARQTPNKVAFTCVMPNGMQGSLSFREVDRLSDQFAAYLHAELRLPPGSRVAIQAPNGLSYPVVAFGVFKAGCTLVNINPLYQAEEAAAVFADASISALVVIDMFADRAAKSFAAVPVKTVILVSAAEFFPAFPRTLIGLVQKHVRKEIPAAGFPHIRLPQALALGRAKMARGLKVSDITETMQPSAIACLQYTGGTTGVSKGAMLTHTNLIMNVLQVLYFAGSKISQADTILTALPLYHIFAFMVNFLTFTARSAHVVLVPNPRPLTNLKKVFEKYPISFITGVNTLFNGLLNEAWFTTMPHPHLKICIAGGMALQEAVAARWQKIVGVPLGEGYGLTETSPVVCFNPLGSGHNGSIGIPIPDTDVTCVDDDFNEVPPGTPGELAVRGPQVMTGYWRRPDETAKVMRGEWILTGDIATMDETGYFRIVDRRKDMILVSGFNVFPNEVEDVLVKMPGVKEAAVVGVPDGAAGEAPKAFIVRTDATLTAEAVRAYCRQHLTGYKVPKFVEFREDLPKSNVGKILRKDLRG